MSDQQIDTYYVDIQTLKQHFSHLVSAENLNLRIDPEVRKTKTRLQELMITKSKNREFVENASKIDKVLNSFFPHHLIGELKRLNKFEKNDDRFYEELVNLYNREQLADLTKPQRDEKHPSIEFVCGEILT